MMISVDIKPQNSSSLSDKSTKTDAELPVGLSFGELLRGVSKESGSKVVQNGALVLALQEGEQVVDTKMPLKKDSLLSLLKGEKVEETLAVELNPILTKNLSAADLKTLVKDAKNFLRDKIMKSEGFKKSEIAALPKTLKGLAQVAKKFGIDVSKITLEEVQVQSKTASKVSLKIDDNELANTETSEPAKPTHKKLKADAKQQVVDTNDEIPRESKSDVKVSVAPKEIKSTPLFKAQTKVALTTEQIVHTKLGSVESKPVKTKANDTLKMLLRGDRASKKESGFTADFSVATARVIAPHATKESSKNLESLLHGDKQEANVHSKVDGLSIPKVDSFDLKLHEAKQMTKYISQDVKTAIEDYKSPFTRVKIALNPQRLGSMELTVVQRGKNLHINLSSNNAAVNALAMNAQDLKVQLTNNGINNASLNFNNNSSDSSQSGFSQQEQNSQQQREAKDEYNYFDNDEKNEEILHSLEIVVPNYA